MTSKNAGAHPSEWIFLPQVLLSGCAVVLAIWMRVPWLGVAALAFLTAETASAARRRISSRWSLWVAWGCSALFGTALILAKNWVSVPQFALLGSLNTLALLLTANQFVDLLLKKRWRLLAVTWGFAISLVLLAYSYASNLAGLFHTAILMTFALLILSKFYFQMAPLLIQGVNTLILLLITLPIADFVMRPRSRSEAKPDPRKEYFLYDNAKKNPGGYASWEAAWEKEGHVLWRRIFLFHPGDPTWSLKPNTRGHLFNSVIAINSLGFRGKEFRVEKGNAYRIVAVGESTTFDFTLNADDRPWTEMLEEMIQDRLHPPRPVEVINAGVPGYTLKHNLARFPTEFLPLKPDMIISYHGYNGFDMINSALPKSIVTDPPMYRPRPLKLLADAEYRVKVIRFKHRMVSQAARGTDYASDPMQTEYAHAYRDLIQITRTNHIQLVLANFSMAVNSKSDRDVIEFYRPVFPLVYRQIKANETHSAIVRQLVDQNPDVCFVDTVARLDGAHDKYFDLMHFTSKGSRDMAEIMFEGIRPILAKEFADDIQPGGLPDGSRRSERSADLRRREK
jgi:lysophospholipase L1-like esterase